MSAWFGDKITQEEIDYLKNIKNKMQEKHESFVFENPPDKGFAKAWDYEDWEYWLDICYKKSVLKNSKES